MATKIYPFKFLDPYNRDDKAIFFGRDAEIKRLYEMIFQSDLVLVYGASGTGKTSLINCGLSNRFETHDWLPIRVRRGLNINESLEKALKMQLGERKIIESLNWLDSDFEDDPSEIHAAPNIWQDLFRRLYARFFRPIYLIFDQFEELYVLGEREEQILFAQTLQDILRIPQPIKILISMREEYLGHLYELERLIPDLLRKKLRVEAMDLNQVQWVIDGLSGLPNSLVTIAPAEKRAFAQQIFEKIKGKDKSLTIQLPYLQVFLDNFYVSESGDDTRQLEAQLSITALSKMGDLGDILREFLDKQVIQIAQRQQIDISFLWKVLSGFVSLEATQEPNTFEALRVRLPDATPELLQKSLEWLVSGRILRYNQPNEVYEVMHDSLARQIHAKRSDEEIAILEVKRLVKTQMLLKPEVRGLLSEKQLGFVEPYLEQCALDDEAKGWIEQSREAIQEALAVAQAAAEREKQLRQDAETQRKSAKQRSYLAMFVAFVAVGATFFAWRLYQEAERQKLNAFNLLTQSLKSDMERLEYEINHAENNLRIFKGNNAGSYLLEYETLKRDSLILKQMEIQQQLSNLKTKK
jgi:dsDNA-binding SOS-regulon protein